VKVADILSVSADELLGRETDKPKPLRTGKVQQLFEEVANLPRHQQQKISAVLEAFIAQHSMESKNAFK
jgi:hypothetical protein